MFLLIPTGIAVFMLTRSPEKTVEARGENAFDIDSDPGRLVRGEPARLPLPRPERPPAEPGDGEPVPDSLMAFYGKPGEAGPGRTGAAPQTSPTTVAKVLQGVKWAADFVKNPREFMYRETLIGRPETAKRFMKNPDAVRGYLNHPSTKLVMNNPQAASALLKVPGLADIVFKSPAAKDPEVMRGIVDSGILEAALASPTAKAFINDPNLIGRISADPEVAKAMANPMLAQAIAQSPNGMAMLQAIGQARP